MKPQCHDCTQYLEFLNDSSILIHVTDDYHGPYNYYHHKIRDNKATQNQKNITNFVDRVLLYVLIDDLV